VKNIFCFGFLFFIGCQGAKDSKEVSKTLININKCNMQISLDGYGRLHKFYANPDTVKLNSSSYLVLSLYSCEGEMDFKEFNIDSGLILSGHYKAANKLTKGVSTNYSASGEESIDTTSSYYPTKTGNWEYYKNGNIIKTENFN
jgi:hypothetical protein